MLAYGVVFVLLLGEIDLSISYVAGIGAVAVAELQLPGSGHQINGLLAMLAGIAICVGDRLWAGLDRRAGGCPVIRRHARRLPDLAGRDLAGSRGTGLDHHPGPLDQLHGHLRLQPPAGWLIAAGITALYAVVVLGGFIRKRRARVSNERLGLAIAKVIGVAIAAFGTVAICNHAFVQGTPLGLPLAGVLVVIFLVALTFLAKRTTFGRHVYAVGGNAEAARRAGINVPRIRTIVFMISSGMAAIGGIILAANINSVSLTFGGGQLLLDSISAAVIGGVEPLRRPRRGAGAFLGALLLATVSNGLNTAGYTSGIIYIVTGVILLFAVTLDTIARRLQVRSGR